MWAKAVGVVETQMETSVIVKLWKIEIFVIFPTKIMFIYLNVS